MCKLTNDYSGMSKADVEKAVLEQEVTVKVVGNTACYEVILAGNDPLSGYVLQVISTRSVLCIMYKLLKIWFVDCHPQYS